MPKGRIQELRTQLLTARFALSAYLLGTGIKGKIAAAIAQTLAQGSTLGTIRPYQIYLWLGKVVVWSGSDRWSAVAAGQ